MMNNNWYSRQLDKIADVHGSIAAKSPQQIKGLVMRCIGVSMSDDAATKVAYAAKNATDESDIISVLRKDGKLPLAAAQAIARSLMPKTS
jgi:chlorite dismutase